MTTIFLSYARGDDVEPYAPATSWVMRLYRNLTAAGFDVWFDRVNMPSRGLTFHQEIRDAIAARDRLLLVVGPKAASSDYVRQEWQFAWFEAEKVVTPILRQGDYPLVIPELTLLHAEDFRDDAQYAIHLEELIRILREPAPPLGKLIGVPSLPAHYLSRTDRLIPLRDAVRSGLDSPAPFGGEAARQRFHGIAGTSNHVGMHGMGGIGKSVLANLLARDREVRKAFPDGIVWVGLGTLPTITELQRRVHRDLGGDGAIATEHEGKTKLKELLADKSVLLVLDDAWRRSDTDAFNVLGPRCRALITTRDAGLLTSLGGKHHLIELLTEAEAFELVSQASGVPCDTLPSEAHGIVAECGRLPLAVSLCGALVRRNMPWSSVLDQLQQARIDRIADRHAVEPQHQSVWQAIHVSVEALQTAEKTRFLELSIFPADETTPEPAAATLWKQTGSLDAWGTAELLTTLAERSLVQMTAPAAEMPGPRRFSLHDLIYDYTQRAQPDRHELHNQLLAAYQKKCPNGWPSGPNDGYFFTHVRNHFVAASRVSEMAALLHDMRWPEAKNQAGLTFDLPFDFRAAIDALPKTDSCWRILKLLEEALRRDINFIARHARDYPQALFQCLWNSAWWYDCPEAAAHYIPLQDGQKHIPPWEQEGPKLCDLLTKWRRQREQFAPDFPWLRACRPPWVHLGTAQRAVLRGHEREVTNVSYSPDGTMIVSGSVDGTLRVWDTECGAELLVMRGHSGFVTCVNYSPDGTRIASVSSDETLRVWDATNGAVLAVWCGHNEWMTSVSYSPDGTRIVIGLLKGTLRIWDAKNGHELSVLRGHESSVTSVHYSPDGMRIVSGSDDKTLRVWDAVNGEELCVLRGHEREVTSVSYSSDGARIVSGSDDGTLRVWDPEHGAVLSVMRANARSVTSVSYSPDGMHIVSGSRDHALRVWDAVSGAELSVLRGHEDQVTSVSYSRNGKQIVSGSRDDTVRVWDAESGAALSTLRGHERKMTSVTYSPDGTRIVSGSDDSTLRVWDVESGAQLCVLRGHEREVKSVAYSPDGSRIVSGSMDETVRVWEAASGELLTVLRGHKDWVTSVIYSPDGAQIASGSDDETLRLWNATSGAMLSVMQGHDVNVSCVGYSPDGTRIVSGSWDWTLRVWDVKSGAELSVLQGHKSRVTSVSYSPDGTRIVSGSNDEWSVGNAQIFVWDAQTFECLEVINDSSDAAAIAIGSCKRPCRTVTRDLETVVVGAADTRPVARFPEQLEEMATSPCGRAWVGGIRSHVQIIQLEGEP